MAIVLHRACGTSPEPGNANSVRVTSTRRAGRESDHDARHRGVRDVRARGIGPKRRVEQRWCRGGAEVVRRGCDAWLNGWPRLTTPLGLEPRAERLKSASRPRSRAAPGWWPATPRMALGVVTGPAHGPPGVGRPRLGRDSAALRGLRHDSRPNRISPIVPALHASDGPPLGES